MLTLAWGKILSNSSVGGQLRHQSAVDKQENLKALFFAGEQIIAHTMKNGYSWQIWSARSKIEKVSI